MTFKHAKWLFLGIGITQSVLSANAGHKAHALVHATLGVLLFFLCVLADWRFR